ncbi:unnamed protein product [Urochloa decumbens]|uniref:Uncharacterized protein n=1 Tax=Urochloa decumbens TaxID=240449 RepID=A0ABC9H4C5_9POAL
MEIKYGPNWRAEHPNFDASVIYEYVGRMPHGKLAIADEAISIVEKEAIKTRKRSAQPHVSAREKRLERENERLRNDNRALKRIEHVVRALAAKGGLNYDALAQEAAANLESSESEGGLSKENDQVGLDGDEDDSIGGKNCYGDEDDEEYNYENAGYNGEDDADYNNRYEDDSDCGLW